MDKSIAYKQYINDISKVLDIQPPEMRTVPAAELLTPTQIAAYTDGSIGCISCAVSRAPARLADCKRCRLGGIPDKPRNGLGSAQPATSGNGCKCFCYCRYECLPRNSSAISEFAEIGVPCNQ